MNDIWDMDSREWGTASQNVINTGFSIGGYTGSVYLNNGCWGSDNDCSGNYICEGYSSWDSQTNTGSFTLNDCQGLPLGVVNVSGSDGFDYMSNYLGW